jgi:hypothetical protein
MENTTDNTLAGAEQNVPAADGGAAVSEEVVELKDLLGTALGKTFPNNEAALKAVTDTFSYVGEYGKVRPVLKQLQDKFGADYLTKIMETTNQPQDAGNFVTKEELATERFFTKNPDYEAHRSVIEAFAKTSGKSLAEAVDLPEIKSLMDKAKSYDEMEKSKSVLQTNPRLGVATDNISKAKEAQKAGDTATAESLAVAAVLELTKE